MRRAAKVDANQAEIVDALRQAGAKVQTVHWVGHGFPDLLVGWEGQFLLLEVKNPKDSHRGERLSHEEQEFFDRWLGYPVHVVCNPMQALLLLGYTLTDEG